MNPQKASIRAAAWAAFGLLAAGLALPAAAQDDRQAIEAAARQWEQAFRSGDTTALAAIYSDDAKLLPPNQEIIDGKDQVIAALRGVMAGGVAEIATETLEIEVTGGMAYRLAYYRSIGLGEEILDRGKALEVWGRVGGQWRLRRDMWSSVLPATRGEKKGATPPP
jgi:uncharacterized protein (TIGR02246 family)